jgi:DNA polymerase-3 subunit epsilon
MRHPIVRLREVSDEIYEVSGLDLPRFSERRLWLFDLEATGLDTTKERITQVAGVPLEGGRLLEDEAFVEYVWPGSGVEIPPVVQELTGITLETLKDARPLPEVWERFARAAEGCDLWIGQSVFEFDVPLLEAEFARHGMSDPLPPILDSVVLATALLGEPEGRWSTSALVNRFAVDTTGLRRHDALDDVKILGRILLPMIELIRREHGDHPRLSDDRPLAVRRHPPLASESESESA